MRRTRLIRLVVLLLSLALHAEATAKEPKNERGSSRAARGDRIDLGTATLGHNEVALGPLYAAYGLFNRVHVGTILAPWFIGLAVPKSVIANAFVKARVFRYAKWSGSVRTSLFHARLNDLDEDGLKVRAWIWPTRFTLSRHFSERVEMSVELTGVYTGITAETLAETDTAVYGLALARTIHGAFVPRVSVLPWLTLFLRGRMLMGHAPVTAKAEAQLSESTRIEVEARTDAAQLSSGFSATAGTHLHWPFLSVTLGGGYGTWFLPWIQLPIGENSWIAEFDVAFRF